MMENHPINRLVEQYLSEIDITQSSQATYKAILKQYITYLSENEILYANTSDITMFIKWMKGLGYSSRWIYHSVLTIKRLYQYLRQNQKRLGLPPIYRVDIAEPIKNVKFASSKSKPILTTVQAKKLIICLKQNRKYIWQYRDYAIVTLMITTGIRSVEVRRAKRKDLCFMDNQYILNIQGKGRKVADEFVKLTPLVQGALNDYLLKRKDTNPYLFIPYRHRTKVLHLSRSFFVVMFRRILKECELEYTSITAHSLRHTAATLNILRGETIEDTRRFLRHEKMSSTLIYTNHIERLNDDSENLIEEMILKEEKYED